MREERKSMFDHGSNGFVVQVSPLLRGTTMYAEIEPAGSCWLPWRGRASRWWYEVHSIGEPDEHGVAVTTWAYIEGGSGGGFTLASCVRKAQAAVARFAEKDDYEWATEVHSCA